MTRRHEDLRVLGVGMGARPHPDHVHAPPGRNGRNVPPSSGTKRYDLLLHIDGTKN